MRRKSLEGESPITPRPSKGALLPPRQLKAKLKSLRVQNQSDIDPSEDALKLAAARIKVPSVSFQDAGYPYDIALELTRRQLAISYDQYPELAELPSQENLSHK
jgi:hypothetical protein